MQIMPYLDRGNFTEILKRLCDNKWWDGDKNAYLKLMELFGQAIGRFQRGGQDADSKKSDMTLVHGDLFTEHVLVGNFDNNAEDMQNVAPKFSLIDLPTLNYVPDPDCTKLLVDPMFLSSIVFFEFRRENFRKGILEIFNNFYLGYVKEFSEKTINKLLELFKNRETAYAAFEKAADYANSVGKYMKTRQEDKFNSSTQIQSFENVPLSLVERKNLEIQLADLHRLAFLHAYYKIMNNDDKAKEILKEEDDWIEAWNNSGLYEKLKMKS